MRGAGGCQAGERCLTHSLWQDLSDRISQFLDGISLGELMAKGDVQEVAGRQDKHKMPVDGKIQVSIQL